MKPKPNDLLRLTDWMSLSLAKYYNTKLLANKGVIIKNDEEKFAVCKVLTEKSISYLNEDNLDGYLYPSDYKGKVGK